MKGGRVVSDNAFAKENEAVAEDVVAFKRFVIDFVASAGDGRSSRGRFEIHCRSSTVEVFVEQQGPGIAVSARDVAMALANLAARFNPANVGQPRTHSSSASGASTPVYPIQLDANPVVCVTNDAVWVAGLLHQARDRGGFDSSGTFLMTK